MSWALSSWPLHSLFPLPTTKATHLSIIISLLHYTVHFMGSEMFCFSWWPHRYFINVSKMNEHMWCFLCPKSLPAHMSSPWPCMLLSILSISAQISHPGQSSSCLPDEIRCPDRFSGDILYFPLIAFSKFMINSLRVYHGELSEGRKWALSLITLSLHLEGVQHSWMLTE